MEIYNLKGGPVFGGLTGELYKSRYNINSSNTGSP
jgi:hypothetical protein